MNMIFFAQRKQFYTFQVVNKKQFKNTNAGTRSGEFSRKRLMQQVFPSSTCCFSSCAEVRGAVFASPDRVQHNHGAKRTHCNAANDHDSRQGQHHQRHTSRAFDGPACRQHSHIPSSESHISVLCSAEGDVEMEHGSGAG